MRRGGTALRHHPGPSLDSKKGPGRPWWGPTGGPRQGVGPPPASWGAGTARTGAPTQPNNVFFTRRAVIGYENRYPHPLIREFFLPFNCFFLHATSFKNEGIVWRDHNRVPRMN